MYFEQIGLSVPTLLLPRPGIDLTRWAVIACDQYSSQPEYWQQVKETVGDEPSALHLILPEIYLDDSVNRKAIEKIHNTMNAYIAEGVLAVQEPGFMLIDRQTPHVASRKGLVVALDLEHYDYRPGASCLIRATEGTILDRMPPRVAIREKAPLELPHIMVLIDDPGKTVIEPLFEAELAIRYDVELMMKAGRIRGYMINDSRRISAVAEAMERLADPAGYSRKYPGVCNDVLLFALGDGNHSFAAAKAYWESLKESTGDTEIHHRHPARFCLVELVNLHDEGLVFKPIHRVLFNVDRREVFREMEAFYRSQGSPCTCAVETKDMPSEYPESAQNGAKLHRIPFVSGAESGTVSVTRPKTELATASLQAFLDDYLQSHPAARIDYIHGEAAVRHLALHGDGIGFYLPALAKNDLFKTIAAAGALPRKAFSMGEADEKRFYLECRKIIS